MESVSLKDLYENLSKQAATLSDGVIVEVIKILKDEQERRLNLK